MAAMNCQCDKTDCRANWYNVRLCINVCTALNDTTEYYKGKRPCPFYKTNAVYDRQIKDLQEAGHVCVPYDVVPVLLTKHHSSGTITSEEVMACVDKGKVSELRSAAGGAE